MERAYKLAAMKPHSPWRACKQVYSQKLLSGLSDRFTKAN